VATLTPRPQFSYPANGWWVVKDTNGAVGLLKGNNPGSNATSSVYIGAADTLSGLVVHFSTAISTAIAKVGASPTQQSALIAQLDSGAAQNGARSFLFEGPDVKPGTNAGVSSDAPTNISSEAVSAGINVPDPVAGVLGGIWTALTNPSNWLRGLEILGAVVAIYLGIRSLTGAPGVVETAEALKP
jgi:hypothetical protein